MFLKSMELMGFKSFADRTHIDFSSGISALLGPNGCGKSNIVDAVKWVLGEQSTKTMRAVKMEDVIFNGTVKRKALNVAEVTLTISNETNILDLDAPEIEIKRRLYRSGDSEYYINNAQVRLKELRELFFDTGIGKTAYSILEQGKIDQILSNRPEERRYLFEEAAGITRYKAKGLEAERKLDKTRENIKQAQNILSEVSRSYFSLKEQSDKTLEYRKIKDELFNIEVNLQLLKIEKLKELHDRRGEEHTKRQVNLKKVEDQIKELSTSLGDSHREQGKLKSELVETQKKIYGLELESESLKNRIRSLKDRDSEYNSQLKGLDKRQDKIESRSHELKKEIDEKIQIEKTLELESKKSEELLNKYVEEVSDFTNEVENNNKNIKDFEATLSLREEKQEVIFNELGNIATIITNKLEEGLKGFSVMEHNALIDMFRKQLVLAKTNPSILYKLEEEFDNLISSFPGFVIDLVENSDDLSRKKELDKELIDIKVDIKSIKKGIKTSSNNIESLNHKIQITTELLSETKVIIAENKVKKISVQESSSLIKKNLSEEESLLNEIKKERTVLSEKIKQLALDKETLLKSREELNKKDILLKEKSKKLEQRISDVKGQNSTKENDLLKKRESLSKLSLQVERYNFESEHLETKVKELYEEFKEKYSLELSEASEELDTFIKDELQLKESIQNLRMQQKKLGQINLMAPEEFKEVSKRYDFLKSQIEDLLKADENLTRITEEIKLESTKLFFETFENIKKSFSVMYQKLFGGGSAELKLTDQKNILDSGIEIYARPPGKSLENIALLSGGERSLTAVALLFATYSIKPSPFCILDEIDAALDERNISRFVSTLTEFSKESQFIVITHNKKTVTGSGALLGITMQESGVSKLITMRLENEEKEE